MSRQQHPNDSVSERRLRPIYDWLDIGNNKKALQEADKVSAGLEPPSDYSRKGPASR
jgi:hypothetical protein